MRRLLVIAVYLMMTSNSHAIYRAWGTEELVTNSNLIVIGRLTDITIIKEGGVLYFTGEIEVSEVLYGKLQISQPPSSLKKPRVTLKWKKDGWVKHGDHTVKGIWFLQLEENMTASADHPDRYRSFGADERKIIKETKKDILKYRPKKE